MKELYLMLGRSLDKNVKEEIRNKVIGISTACKVYMLNPYKNNVLKQLLFGIDNIEYIDFDIRSVQDWPTQEALNKEFIKQHGIKNFMIIGTDLNQSSRIDNFKLYTDFLSKYMEDRDYGINYVTTRFLLTKFLVVKDMVECGVNVLHFVIDPQEVDFNQVLGNGSVTNCYKLARKGYTFLPSYEFALMYINGKFKPRENNLLFYCTAKTPDRKYVINIAQKLKRLPSSDIKVIYKGSVDGKGVEQNEYYGLLRKYKFTLIIPSYDQTTFSIVRFLEAIANGCIPLVLGNCNLDELQMTYPSIYSVVNDELIVKSIDDIKDKINKYDKGFWSRIMKCVLGDEHLNEVINVRYMRKMYDKILK